MKTRWLTPNAGARVAPAFGVFPLSWRYLYRTGTSGTLLESIDFNSTAVSTSWSWHTINFSGATWLSVGETVALTIESIAGAAAIEISYKASGVSAANSAMLRGNPTWYSSDPNAALQYRVSGGYTTSDNVAAVAGTWEWDGP